MKEEKEYVKKCQDNIKNENKKESENILQEFEENIFDGMKSMIITPEGEMN